jgi:hypothetical protein
LELLRTAGYLAGKRRTVCILENLQRRDVSPVEEVVSFGKLMEIKGCEIYEMQASPLPEEPRKPLPEQFESETEYQKAEASYASSLLQHKRHSGQIEARLNRARRNYS